MKTKLPLSTIAYDEDTLCRVLIDQFNKGVISFFAYIRHYGESKLGLSEGKDHFHVYVEFNNAVDPLKFKGLFVNEFGNSTCLNWRASKFADWYYYVLHDPLYLQSKGLVREYEYEKEGIQCLDPLELDRLIVENPRPFSNRVREALDNGLTELEMFRLGLLNSSNVAGVQALQWIVNPEKKMEELQKNKDKLKRG